MLTRPPTLPPSVATPTHFIPTNSIRSATKLSCKTSCYSIWEHKLVKTENPPLLVCTCTRDACLSWWQMWLRGMDVTGTGFFAWQAPSGYSFCELWVVWRSHQFVLTSVTFYFRVPLVIYPLWQLLARFHLSFFSWRKSHLKVYHHALFCHP